MESQIPFNRPYVVGTELDYIAEAVIQGNIGADGHFTERCGQYLEDRFAILKVLMTPSCTAALEMAAMLCDVHPGDEIILPSFTFVSTASAFVRLGAVPVFVDIRPDTLNLDVDCVERAITSRTKAIVPVHYAGVACDMDPILEIANRRGLFVVEDAAQGVNARYGDRALGAIGHLGAYSFHETKNFICGEGGALCINDPEMIRRAEILRNKGTNRSEFLRGEVDKYTWVDIGSSYVLSEVCCAFLFAQFEQMSAITDRRRQVFTRYFDQLQPAASAGRFQLPALPDRCQPNFHMFYMLVANEEVRDQMLEHYRKNEIQAVFHYVPLHTSPVGRRFGYSDGDLPVTEEVSRRLIRLPFYTDMTPAEQDRVVQATYRFLDSYGAGRGASEVAPSRVFPS